MSRRTPDGQTERDHLQAHARATGEAPPELILPPIPPGCHHLWELFLQLNSSRPSGAAGASAISPTDILAWQTLAGVQLNPWELDVLQALDRVVMNAIAEEQKRTMT